jgi:zinc transport system substrate-binding protein
VARIVLTFGLVLLLAAASGGCGGDSSGPGETVVAGFYPLAYAAARVGDSELEVMNLTPPGVEPHDLELSGRHVRAVADARVVLYLGSGFQPALERAVESTGATALDLLDDARLGAGDGRDPHVWLDPLRYAALVEGVAAALDRADAAQPMVGELRALDRELRSGLRDCERRELVTSHAAFGYLAERYDLEQVPITGLSPEAEPTPGELRDVVEEVREQGATTIFFETLVSPRLAQTVAREVGAATAVLNPLEGLTEQQAADGEDYFSIMRANLAALRKALQCR